jgi:hypothetical protein
MGLKKMMHVMTHDNAKTTHKEIYDGEFEVVLTQRCGFPDMFLINILSFLTSFSDPGKFFDDIGRWKGLVNTDGKK